MAIRVKTQKFVSLDDRMEPEDGAAICQIEARGYTPEQLCSQHEFECLFRNLAASVRQSSRRVFELHIANDLSGLEIARVLGLTPSVVKARLHRAKHDLRRTMSKYPPLTGASRKDWVCDDEDSRIHGTSGRRFVKPPYHIITCYPRQPVRGPH